jgi:adenylate kinase
MERGELVSDEVMTGIVRERLERPDALHGFVLDGFPRTVGQAVSLDSIMDGRGPLVVVDLVVPEVEIARRLGARLICADCGANAGSFANTLSAVADQMAIPGGNAARHEAIAAILVPLDPQRCDRCGGCLVQRADDDAMVVLERLKVYHRQTEPLVEYYRKRPTFRSVNGAVLPDQVAAALVAAIDAAAGGELPQADKGVRL